MQRNNPLAMSEPLRQKEMNFMQNNFVYEFALMYDAYFDRKYTWSIWFGKTL